MGLSNFPASASDGLLPALLMNTVFCVALLFRSLLEVVGLVRSASGFEDGIASHQGSRSDSAVIERRISNTQYKFLLGGDAAECCVCLSRFEAEEEVSELFCRHFFHRDCLDKWFDCYNNVTCPLCRSIC